MVEPRSVWVDQVPEQGDQKSPINTLDFSSDGSQLIVGVGSRVLVYNANNGKLLNSLKGHKSTVYSVSFCRSNETKQFASGGADKTVILWNEHGKGILKYTHHESIQVVAYNPKFEILASCSNVDFGFWVKSRKSVVKHKVLSKILAATWSPDGNIIALGMLSGIVSLRNIDGDETIRITRSAPIWALVWIPSRDMDRSSDILVTGCWDKTLSFYDLSGLQNGKDIELDFYPCGIDFFDKNGGYLVVSGSNKNIAFCSKDGIKLKTLLQGEEWIWTVKSRPLHEDIALGDFGGKLALETLHLSSIHAIYKERYAYRDYMTQVVVQNFSSGYQIRIDHPNSVEKIAIYQNHLAVKTLDMIIVYETSQYDSDGMRYEIKERIEECISCDLLSLSSKHLIIARNDMIELYDFKGKLEKEWNLDSNVIDMKVYGGVRGKEALLVGMKNGDIMKIFIDCSFPIHLLRHSSGIRYIEINAGRTEFAFLDDELNLCVYNAITGARQFREEGVHSFSFKIDSNDTICFNREGIVFIKMGHYTKHVDSSKIQGQIIFYRGNKVYYHNFGEEVCIHYVTQSKIVEHHLKNKEFDQAYQEASAGIPLPLWQSIADKAMDAMKFDVARKCFLHMQETTFMGIMDEVRKRMEHFFPKHCQNKIEKISSIFNGSIDAFRGEYQNAAKAFIRSGEVQKAIDLYIDLKKWDEAEMIAVGTKTRDSQNLIKKQAEWEEALGNWKDAAQMYVKAGNVMKAIDLIGKNKEDRWEVSMISIVRDLSLTEAKELQKCALYFAVENKEEYARETYIKLKDFSSIIKMYTQSKNWMEVKKLFEEYEDEFDKFQLMPYGEWLATNEHFEEALRIYRKVGCDDKNHKLLENITENAINEGRFKDVVYYFWLQREEWIKGYDRDNNCCMEHFFACGEKSSWYHAYHFISDYCDSPFTNLQPDTLFQVALYLINSLSHTTLPRGISRAKILYTLAKQASFLGAYEVARFALRSMQDLKIPSIWEDRIELDSILIQTKSSKDREDLLPVCYRCGSKCELIRNEDVSPRDDQMYCTVSSSSRGRDKCPNCGHNFIRCMLNFDILPLVEFAPDKDISDEEAVELLREVPAKRGNMKIQKDTDELVQDNLFEDAIDRALENQQSCNEYNIVTVDRKTLHSLSSEEVFICLPVRDASDNSETITCIDLSKTRYFKNMIPEVGIALSQSCQMFFHEEDYEFMFLKEGGCPISRLKDIGHYGHFVSHLSRIVSN